MRRSILTGCYFWLVWNEVGQKSNSRCDRTEDGTGLKKQNYRLFDPADCALALELDAERDLDRIDIGRS